MDNKAISAGYREDAGGCDSVADGDVAPPGSSAVDRLPSPHRVLAVLPVVAMITTVSFWGPSFVATKAALSEIPPFTLAFLRFLVASIVLYPLWRMSGERAPIRANDRRRLLLSAMLGIAFYFILFNLGMQRTTAAVGALLMATIPVVCLLVEAVWFRLHVSRVRGLGIAVSIVGVFMVVGQAPSSGGEHRLAGDLLVMTAAVCWAIYTLIGRGLNHLPKLGVVAHQAMYGTLMLSPFAIWELGQWHEFSLTAWLCVLYLGVLCSAIAFVLYNYALKSLAASQVTAFLNLVPVIGVIAAVLLLGEQIRIFQIVGGVVILVGVAVSTRS